MAWHAQGHDDQPKAYFCRRKLVLLNKRCGMSAALRIQLLAIVLLASVHQATAAVELVLVFHRHGAR